MRLRFAPSPTGHLHVGNARTALFNWLLARGRGGSFVLRIEDTDVERSTAESERGIVEDLRWLGLDWDEGPGVAGAHGPYRQSERLPLYAQQAQRLLRDGKAYYCFCTPEQLEEERRRALESGHQPRYSGRCRSTAPRDAAARVAAGEAAAVRFHVPPGLDVVFADAVRGEVRFSRDVIGDPVILRSDGHPAYNFAVVVDDALMGITDVIRGEDHVSNTPRQLLLYDALGWEPPRFAHVSMVLGPDHTPLSKRHGATSVAEFRSRGVLPEALVNYLALLGWSPGEQEEILPLDELARRFDIADVGKRASVFDREKLAWMNRHYMKLATPERLRALLEPSLVAQHFASAPNEWAAAYIEQSLVPMFAGAVNWLDEAVARIRFVFAYDAAASTARPGIAEEFRDPAPRGVVQALAEVLVESPRLIDRETFRAAAARVREQTGQRGRGLFHPIRVALTGEHDGPELDLAVPAIDRGAELPRGAGLAPIPGCRERAQAFRRSLENR